MATAHHFIPSTDLEINEMFETIGVRTFDDLLEQIPKTIRSQSTLDLPPQLSEANVTRLMRRKSQENGADLVSFLGAGIYDHFIPAAVDAMLQRSEFYTAYTPYQAEVSQGTLQAIYEFQTMICELYAMDIANASVYDGSSALTEAVLLAHAETRRRRIVFAGPVHPYYRAVLESCTVGIDLEFVDADIQDGASRAENVVAKMDSDTACVVVQQPNFYGLIEDIEPLAETAHTAGALLIVSADPLAMAMLEPPGKQGADIVIGEGQSIGIAPQFGGPVLGLFAMRDGLKRRLPGRLVGRSLDSRGQQAFVLTLQTREQHIRRDKATSNICTNQNLMALAATVYLSLAGPRGLRSVSETCLQHAHYAASEITRNDGYELAYGGPFFLEFVVRCPKPAREIISQMLDRGIVAGVNLHEFGGEPDELMIAVTEQRTREDIDALVSGLHDVA
jgi:glycine dehydrogenase subunit 1